MYLICSKSSATLLTSYTFSVISFILLLGTWYNTFSKPSSSYFELKTDSFLSRWKILSRLDRFTTDFLLAGLVSDLASSITDVIFICTKNTTWATSYLKMHFCQLDSSSQSRGESLGTHLLCCSWSCPQFCEQILSWITYKELEDN